MPDENVKSIGIMEVCPRDGWQNLPDVIPHGDKLHYIEMMLDAGIRHMQICSFVSPKAVPQMIDAKEIAGYFAKKYPDRRFNALVPNLRGAQTAAECGINDVCYVVSASESHNKANVNRTVDESMAALEIIREELPELRVTLSVATAFGCPFEGPTPPEKVLGLIERGVKLGIRDVELADTIGVGDPVQVEGLFRLVRQEYPGLTLYAHMHDTRNNGVANSYAAISGGADVIHGALGGLGGCPFAPGASGNTATEDLVWLFEKSGIATGIDFDRLLDAAREMHAKVNGNYSGHQIMVRKAAG